MSKLVSLFVAGFASGIFCQAAPAGVPSFRVHPVNPDSTYSACAAFDVNRDGKLDIVCGGFWYEAPKWKRHFLRDVQVIRGRYDDYAHLPLDVNGDGWTDYVSANWRSRSIYWVGHPGKSLGPWTKHVIDTPGNMETARLYDIDGDGRIDVLPNCVRTADGRPFAAWWELVQQKTASDRIEPRWVRHDLPPQVAGHGVGFGDITGDGRGDIIGSHGFLEAPNDRRKGRWIWRREFELHRDCSIPILVHDVDCDGDNDVIWGRGHNTGLYWLEQLQGAEKGSRRWRRHVIDTSWSQPHSLLLADVTGDNRPELIAGKRFMGHDGKDPGEYDPLAIYWYQFNASKSWNRGAMSQGGGVGFGLDPKAADLDADGDTDFVVSGRSGLFWIENLLVNEAGAKPDRVGRPPEYDDHTKLLIVKDRQSKPNEVATKTDWAQRRSHILHGMQQAMGSLPNSVYRPPLDVQLIEESDMPSYVRRKITYRAELLDRVPAYVLIPKGLETKAPAILCLHQTTKIGKDEPAGLGGRATLQYAHELAERGYVCIVPDYPSFGEYPYDFTKPLHLHYQSGTMKAIWNNIRAVDVLETLPEVNPDRIAAIGHSLGGHNALFTAPFDLRLKAVVTSCGFTAFHHYKRGNLAGWTSPRYMPRIGDIYKNDPDKVPFDFYEVLGAIAPRPIFINAPLDDGNFDVTGVKKVVAEVGKVYELLEAGDHLTAVHPDSGHDFPDKVRRQAYDWLDRQLK